MPGRGDDIGCDEKAGTESPDGLISETFASAQVLRRTEILCSQCRSAISVVGHVPTVEESNDTIHIVSVRSGGKLKHIDAVIGTVDDLLVIFESADKAFVIELAEVPPRFSRCRETDVFRLGLTGSKFLQQIINGKLFEFLSIRHVNILLTRLLYRTSILDSAVHSLTENYRLLRFTLQLKRL
jgi:hypothetical protein